MRIIFRQLFDAESSTCTYLLADPLTADAVLIDTVREHTGAYLTLLQELGLKLRWTLETHVHADHVTAAASLRELAGSRAIASTAAGADCADLKVDDGSTIVFGNEVIRVIATPGHTPGCVTYRWCDRVFTGDALLIDGCGRTDFQGGDAGTLYDSITTHLFTLPAETLVYPGHDYKGRRVSSIGEQKTGNPRLAGQTREEFVALMAALDLPPPRKIDLALPANQACGRSIDTIEIQGV
ncbi:MBL fold metallo-hydrolase [Nitrogeniibacter mangrovi]|uniref:MBL fold metallo-hydrolase n=1 Tax=Nitrogeniibacter mangrovi TaxID=2016596 RepID=UPI002B4025E3|nr:MBL fold metallo-hydrolase [Nitrogeniibacter mangrovi]